MSYPKIPTRIRGAGGPISVRQVNRAKSDNGDPCWGTWERAKRIIRIEKGAPIGYKFHTLYHEWSHAVLDDAGLSQLLSEEGVESLCEAFATSRMQEMRGQLVIRE